MKDNLKTYLIIISGVLILGLLSIIALVTTSDVSIALGEGNQLPGLEVFNLYKIFSFFGKP